VATTLRQTGGPERARWRRWSGR